MKPAKLAFFIMMIAAVTTTGSAQAAPGDMMIANFIAKADALKAMGMRAMFSSDLKVVMNEGKGAGAAYRARLATDRAAGRPPHSCPPAKARMKSDEVLAHLNSYTPAQRRTTSVTTAIADMMVRRYPCAK